MAGKIQTGSNHSMEDPTFSSVNIPVGNIVLNPVWDQVPKGKGHPSPPPETEVVMVGGNQIHFRSIQQHYPNLKKLEIQAKDTVDGIAKKLAVHGSIDHIFWIAPHRDVESLVSDAFVEEQDLGVLVCFRMVKALLRLGYGAKELGWTTITTQTQSVQKNELVNPSHASIHGLIGTLAKEYSNWKVRLLDMEADSDWPMDEMVTLPADKQGRSWGYRSKQWYRQQLVPFECPSRDLEFYKSGGVYVVIGGAGTIGEAWSEFMIKRYKAQIIWVGRRKKDASIQAKLNALATLGPVPTYIQADATDQDSLEKAYKKIKQDYSQIHGVIHSAVVFSDESLASISEQQFQAGLSAKVEVSVRLAQVFQKEALDFVLFFSSLIAFIKNPRQSHYASGCTFKDAFAHQLSQGWPCAVKVMNWGYWSSNELFTSKALHNGMLEIGLGLIEPPEAMKALDILLAGPVNQLGFIKTTSPMAVEGMNSDEMIQAYPTTLPSVVRSVESSLPKQNLQSQYVNPKFGLQTDEMDELLSKLLWAQLQSVGLVSGKNLLIAELTKKAGIDPAYDRWFEESIMVLARKNYLQYKGVFFSAH